MSGDAVSAWKYYVMSSLLLALIFAPAIGAAVAFILRGRQLLAVATAVLTIGAQGALLAFTPDGRGGLLGLDLQLGSLERLYLAFALVPLLTAILYHARVAEESNALVTTALAVNSGASLVALSQNPYASAISLLASSLVLSLGLVAVSNRRAGETVTTLLPVRPFAAALRYLSLATLASVLLGVALILADYYRLNPDQRGLLKAAFAFLVCGLALRLGVVPFHYWLATLFDPGRGSGLTGLLAVGSLSGAAVLFAAHTLAGLPPLLLQNDLARLATQGLGMGGAILGATLAYAGAERRTRILAYLYVADAGVVLFGLGSGTALGLSGALMTAFGYSLSVPLFLVSLNLVEAGASALVVRAGLVVAGLSLVGFVPLYGFAARYQLYAAAAQLGWGWLAALLLASLLMLAAVARHFTPLLFATATTSSTGQAASDLRPDLSVTLLLLVLLASSIALGLYPAPLTGVIGQWVRGLGWLL